MFDPRANLSYGFQSSPMWNEARTVLLGILKAHKTLCESLTTHTYINNHYALLV